MRKCTGLVLLVVLIINSIEADIPQCDYFDTVRLEPSQQLEDGSYRYERITIPPEQTGEYDYEILHDGERVEVAKHLRGCACHLGTCIRLCCKWSFHAKEESRECNSEFAVNFKNPLVNITLNDGKEVTRHILDDFIVQDSLPVPCARHFHLDSLNVESHRWSLFENGTLLRHKDVRSLGKQEYCLQPYPIFRPNEVIVSLVPLNCYDKTLNSQILINFLRLLSIIFLLITIIVYLSYDKLRNLHGLCFVNYMICISVGFAVLLIDDLFRGFFSKLGCQFVGYLGYFAVMAGFNWLTVISYDLWTSFKGNNYNVQRKASKFGKYNLYAWGVAFLLTLIIMILDGILDSDNEDLAPFIPGVALYTCWVKTFDWSSMLYFHGIITLQIIFNIIMFTLTSIRIVELRSELKSLTLPEEREKHVHLNKQTFGMFLRLFVITGIIWIFEIFAYLAQNHRSWERFFTYFDYVNCSQGIIIFILFVLKRKVLKMISNRCRGIRSNDDDDCEEEIALQDRNGVPKNVGPNILK